MDSSSIVISFILCLSTVTVADVLVYTEFSNQLSDDFRDLPAKFGKLLPPNGVKITAVNGNPKEGCQELDLRPNITKPFGVLIQRGGNCTFEEKVRNAQLAGYDMAIVYNINSNDLETMSAQNGDDIFIYAIFVGETSGRTIIKNYLYNTDYFLIINDDLPFNINTHLILPFSIVVGLVFIVIIGFMVVKCVREQRRLRRRRLPRSLLKSIPIIKFNKANDRYDTCAICLDDYVEGDKLRVLPCSHAYHTKCIDPWLTKTRRDCPICKRKVLPRRRPRRPPSSDRHSSDYSSSASEYDDRSPLINPVVNSSNHGTFNSTVNEGDNQANRMQPRRENPFNRPVIETEEITNDWHQRIPLWNTIRNIFNRTQTTPANIVTPELPQNVPDVQVAVLIDETTNTSNNILNANLSGSFRDNNDAGDTGLVGQSSLIRVGVAALPNTEFSSSSTSTSHSSQQHSHNLNKGGTYA